MERPQTIVFDWGDTIMVNDPTQRGSMAAWPEVFAVPGVQDGLGFLAGEYRLVLATNAADSRAPQVRQALARVSLDRYFSAVFTAAELGARKPDPAFFIAIQSVLGARPDELLMVGDDYRVDIIGAKNAGWQAAWFNPGLCAAPALLPLQDLEFTHWDQFAGLLNNPLLPAYAQCLAWIQAQPVSANLLAHIHAVAAVAYQLALWLKNADVQVDPLLTHRGGLLHDLAKIKALQRPRNQRIGHADLAGRLLQDLGQPVISEIARRHPLHTLNQPDLAPRTWEEKLVYFADKLVEGSRIASLEERIAALRQRYPDNAEEIAAMVPALKALQKEICAAAGIPPDDLVSRLKSASITG